METDCRWCTPYEDGTVDMTEFVNPQNREISATLGLSPNTSQLFIELTLPGEKLTGQMRQDISFCPMCGRRLRE